MEAEEEAKGRARREEERRKRAEGRGAEEGGTKEFARTDGVYGENSAVAWAFCVEQKTLRPYECERCMTDEEKMPCLLFLPPPVCFLESSF